MKISQLAIAAAALALTAPAALAAPFTFTVDGVEARGGTLYIGVQTEAQFMKPEGIAGTTLTAPTAGTHTVTFDLPAGDYSVSVWHDEDGDYVFDLDENGMPADGWAMINGQALAGAPTFEAVKITLPEDGASASAAMIYPR